jgi:nickel/cobalt transporter (NicO) family protein
MSNKPLTLLLFILCLVVSASAHPLGNFSVNQFSRITIEREQILVKCVLDLAEIPTFQASQEIDNDGDTVLSQQELDLYAERITPSYLSNLRLVVDGAALSLRSGSRNIVLTNGAGGLNTIRVEWEFIANNSVSSLQEHRLRFENANYTSRVGWNEIIVSRVGDINVFNSDRYATGLSDELRSYPEEMLTNPPDERSAELAFSRSSIPTGAIPLQNRNGSPSTAEQDDKLARLIAVPVITPEIMIVGVLIAFGLGAVHAMSPGHGKTVVGAYLVGSKGTLKHAAFLGVTVTITHTIGVFAVGLITVFASSYILPERIMPFLSFVSGLLVLAIGLSLFKSRLLSLMGYQTDADHSHHHHHHPHTHQRGHSHAHGDEGQHDHDHGVGGDGLTHTHDGHTHSHAMPDKITWRSLLSLGISGGLLPCPSALILMLSSIALNRIGYGFLLTVAFSVGLAATLMCVGIAFLYLGKLLDGPSISGNPVVKALPVLSAFVIACVGAVICYGSIM